MLLFVLLSFFWRYLALPGNLFSSWTMCSLHIQTPTQVLHEETRNTRAAEKQICKGGNEVFVSRQTQTIVRSLSCPWLDFRPTDDKRVNTAHSPGREMQGTSPVVTFNNPSYHSRHTFRDLLPVPQKLKGPIFAALLPLMAPSPLQPTAACNDLPAPSQLRSWRYLNALQDFSRVLRDGDRNMPAWHDGCFISVLLLGSSTEQRVWVTARGGTGQHQCHWTAQLHRSNVVLTQ